MSPSIPLSPISPYILRFCRKIRYTRNIIRAMYAMVLTTSMIRLLLTIGPRSPGIPSIPSSASKPGIPSSPGGPIGPGKPCFPGTPGSPGTPVRPEDPLRPGGPIIPLVPFLPSEDVKYTVV